MKTAKSIMAAFILAMSIGTVSAHAETTETNSDDLGKKFSDPWSKTIVNTSTETFKVGYNVRAINEDYTHTYAKSKSHTAYVKNTGSAQNLKESSGKYAKAEIRHHAGTVHYSFKR